MKPVHGLPRVLADTVKIYTYAQSGHIFTGIGDDPEFLFWMNTYKFHENNRIDTICNPTQWTIRKYSDKNQLLSESTYYPGHESNTGDYTEPLEILDATFEYGEDGRLTKVMEYNLDTTLTYNYVVTDSSYILDQLYEYILDDQGRVIRHKIVDNAEDYVTDPDGRRLRVEDTYYFYFDGGFTSIKCYHRSPSGLYAPYTWAKKEYYFQENGYLSKQMDYIMEDGETEWRLYEHSEWSYHYIAGNPLPNAVIEEPDGRVYAAEGAVIIETEQPATVSVYSFDGQLITQQRVAAGVNRLALSKGAYIVSIHGKGYKVAVN